MENDLGTLLLLKLFRRKCWAHKMINESDLIKLAPKHLRGEARDGVGELYKEGLLNRKPGIQKEFRYSLRVDKKREIEKQLIKYNYNTFNAQNTNI